MTQVQSESSDGDISDGKAEGIPNNNYEPVLRITTANSGTVLIRFTSQVRFDGWMGLFSDEDRKALVPRSSSVPSVFVRHRSHSLHSPRPPLKPEKRSPEMPQGTSLDQNLALGTEQSSVVPKWEDPQKRRSWGDRFSFSSHQPIWTLQDSTAFSSNRESSVFSSTTYGYSTDEYLGQPRRQVSENEWSLVNSNNNNSPPLMTNEQLQDTIPHMNTNYSEQPQPQQPQIYHPHYQMPLSQSMSTIQEQTVTEQGFEKQYQQAPGDLASLPSLTAPGIRQSLASAPPIALPPDPPLNSQPPNSISEENYDDDDDSDDLYDPEFGIGGNCHRRCQRRTKFCSDIRSSGGRSARRRPTSSILSALSSGLSSSAAVIPSAAIISATAAVSAGWSECEALAAATADPSCSCLKSPSTRHLLPHPVVDAVSGLDSRSRPRFDSARPLNHGNRAP